MRLLTWSLTAALIALPVLNDTVSAQAGKRGEAKPRMGGAVERSSPPQASKPAPGPSSARGPRESGPPAGAGVGEATRGGRRPEPGGAREKNGGSEPKGYSAPWPGEGSQAERVYGGSDQGGPVGRATGGPAGSSYSKPRDGRPSVGQAVVRTIPPPRDPGRTTAAGYSYRNYYQPYYESNYYRYPYYGGSYQYSWYGDFGFGRSYYDPYWWSYPTYYGYGGYGPYSSYGRSYYSYDRDYYAEMGGLRLKVTPRYAQVFVDGYYVGTVDEFDGVFQRMNLDVGPHSIEIRADGYIPLVFDVRILIAQTITYRAELQRIP